jgi:hypothetical protein
LIRKETTKIVLREAETFSRPLALTNSTNISLMLPINTQSFP